VSALLCAGTPATGRLSDPADQCAGFPQPVHEAAFCVSFARKSSVLEGVLFAHRPIIRQLKYSSFLLLAADPRICLLIDASAITVSRMQ
jgi:hypothetical protein